MLGSTFHTYVVAVIGCSSTTHTIGMPDRFFPLVVLLLLGSQLCCRDARTQAGHLPADSNSTASSTVFADTILPRPIEFRGVNYAHIHRRGLGYGSAASVQELDSLKAIGVNWTAITPFGFQQSASADQIVGFAESEPKELDPSMETDDLKAEIEFAHQRGIHVALKPHIWSHDFWNGGQWHGTVQQPTPQAHARWWNSYRAMTLHYANLAEGSRADLFCIGTELVKMTTTYPEEWRTLIADVRKVYHGPLTYAAHWEREFDSIPFWDALEYIGITAYFPLNVPDTATVGQLAEAWGPHLERIGRLAKATNRPVLFMEIGYRPATGIFREPWRYDGGTLDYGAQQRAYEAMFRAATARPWFKGLFLWKAFTAPDRAARHGEDIGFTFRRTPAEAVVKKWFLGSSNK